MSGGDSDRAEVGHLPGRCTGCGFHVATQGHRQACDRKASVTADATGYAPKGAGLIAIYAPGRCHNGMNPLGVQPWEVPHPDDIAELERLAAERRRRLRRAAQRLRTATNKPALGKWLENTFQGVIDDVRNTPKGNRNNRLRWGARRLAEISHAGLDEDLCIAALEGAARDNGLWNEDGARQCQNSIHSGWRKGIREPEDLSQIGQGFVTP